MTWGIPTQLFLQIHVVLSLVGIATGLVAVIRMAQGRHDPAWVAAFLVTTFLTGVTGFPLPPYGIDPPRIVGMILMVALASTATALYGFAATGAARAIYIVGAFVSLWLNVFVAIVQSFQKIGPLAAIAPTQSEPPFFIAQALALVTMVVLGVLAFRRFHPAAVPVRSMV